MKINANILTSANDGVKFNVHATIPFRQIKNRIKFTSRHSVNSSPYSNKESEMYQRPVDPKRIKAMKEFVLEEIKRFTNKDGISVLFPTTIILSALIEHEQLSSENGILQFNLDELLDDMLVVDGQHRLKSFLELLVTVKQLPKFQKDYKGIPKQKIIDYIENHLLSCTILINFDIWEQAKVFMNVNFHQKKVSKSLTYDIYGLMPEEIQLNERNKLKVVHDIVKYLNGHKASPIKDFVKMLGTGTGYISQAFLVDALYPHFEEKGIWYEACRKYTDKIDDNSCDFIPFELISYFKALKNVCNQVWPKDLNDKTTIICKTTSMGALIRLLGNIHENIPASHELHKLLGHTHSKDVYDNLTQYFEDCLSNLGPNQHRLFEYSSQNIYVKSAGASLQRTLYLELKDIVFEE